MKKSIQLLVVLCIFVITGCKTNKERYLSITTSGYDKKGNVVVNIYEYSLSSKKVTKKYTSSNPLGVYSKSNNAVYYVEEDNSGILQLQIDFNSNSLSDFIQLDKNYSSTYELINDIKQKLKDFSLRIDKSLKE